MSYTPVAQRTGSPEKTTYTPVSQRQTLPTAINGSAGVSYTPVAQRVATTTSAAAPVERKVDLKGLYGLQGGSPVENFKRNIKPLTDRIANTKYFQDVALGMDQDPNKETYAEKILKPASFGFTDPENIPFGIGAVVKAGKEYVADTDGPNVTISDVLKAAVEVGKETAKAWVVKPALTVAAGAIGKDDGYRFDLSKYGLGEITSGQFDTVNRIKKGEDANTVFFDEATQGVMGALFLFGTAARAFISRPVVVARGKSPGGISVAEPQSSFKLYKEPTPFTQALNPGVVEKMAKEGSLLPGAKYDPKLPTYFRMTGKTGGEVVGEVVQIKPSYVQTFINKLKGDYTKVPADQVLTIAEKTVPAKAFTDTKVEVRTPAAPISQAPASAPVVLPVTTPTVPSASVPAPVAPVAVPSIVPPVVEAPITQIKAPISTEVAETPRYVPVAKRVATPAPIAGSSANASVGKFRDGTPITLGQIENVKPIELPEMVELAKEIMGATPKIRTKVSRAFGGQAQGIFKAKENGDIILRADLFDPKVTNPDQIAKVLAHEIGHLVDYLPDTSMRRGNLAGRLTTLRGYTNELIAKFGTSRSDSAMNKELWDFSKYWRPLDEATASPGFLKYRKSGKELYADFVSGLMNDPVKVQQMAPEAYNTFFEFLDKKPAVKDAYFELQAMLHGERSSIIKMRREGVQQMFKEGDIKSVEYQKRLELERRARTKTTIDAIKFNLIDNNSAMLKRLDALKKNGVTLNMDEDPRYMLEERNYLGGVIKAQLEKHVAPVFEAMKKNDISWDTFGEALFYERILAGDRSKQANPRGITPEAAKELYDALKAEMGEKMPVIEQGMTDFRKWIRDAATTAYQEGLYSPELYAEMQTNPAYVTFRVIEHIEEGVTSKIYQSIGTLKDITNPADATILKTIATIRAIEYNKVTRTSVDFLLKHYTDEIEKATSVFSGKGRRFIESKKPNHELITFKRQGKTEGYYVDTYIGHSLRNDTLGNNKAIMASISPVGALNRNWFRPVYIGLNMGFQSFNLLRDFQRFYKTMPGMSVARSMQRYFQAMPVAKARAFGVGSNEKADKIVQDLEEAKVFSTTFTDMMHGAPADERQIELILRNSGIDSFKPEVRKTAWKKLITPFVKVLETIQKVGNFIETLPKAAAVYEIAAGDVSKLTAADRSFIRKNVGSPDFFRKAYMTPVTNELFLFSNAIKEGIRSDLAIATDPKTRSGYWWKTAKINLLPKILMYMASTGLFGAGVKDLMDSASEYDKTNYTIVPLGRDENGKAIYLRLPQDESGRFIGAIFWKSLAFFNANEHKSEGRQLSDIFAFLGGQVPSLSPVFTTGGDILTYLQGKNPYDSFRGRNVLSDELFKAKNWDTHKAFLGYIVNQLGGGVIYRFNAGNYPGKKSDIEEMVNLPVVSNIVGRFIRVSDYGKTEELKEVSAGIEQEQARETLENRKLINKYVEKALEAGNDPATRAKFEQELVNERFGGSAQGPEEGRKAAALKAKFRTSFIKGVSGPEIDALAGAGSNKEKVALLRDIKTRMSEEEFAELKQTVLKEKIVSSEVIYKYENEI